MTKEEFQTWYDTLNQEGKLRVLHLIDEEPFDVKLPDEHPDIQQSRVNIHDKFYGGKK